MSAVTDDDPARHDDRDGAAQRDAVAASEAVFARRWPQWCAEQGVAASPRPVLGPPVVYRVGPDLGHVQWVALLRFEVDLDGERWQGTVRGPADDEVFKVRPPRHRHPHHRRHWGRH